MTTATQAPPMSAETLFDLSFTFVPSRVLMTAIQLDLFTAMKDGTRTAAEVARHANASERGTRMMLNVLVSLGLVDRDGDGYRLTPAAEKHLVRGTDGYLGAMFESDDLWTNWGTLTETVKTGAPIRTVEKEELASQFFPILVKSLHVINLDVAKRAADALASGLPKDAQVLDVAAGSAVWSIPFAERGAKVTALDFPAVLDTTRHYARKHNVEDRFEFLPGNMRDVNLGENRFDLAILGNIVHSEGEAASRGFFAKLHKALKPGGQVMIVEMIPNDDRSGPPFPLGFALNMLLHTTDGDTYTFAELSSWLKDAGFSKMEKTDVGFHSPLVVATK
ncbi:MAG: methyltransferase domain-containing protein [Armatimonadetes bacterium]|nr:methyltransferase domain-containing protein [Armatimonadota bacterium]